MCLQLFLACDAPIAPPFAPEAAGLLLRQLPPDEANAVIAFSKRHICAIGLEGSCGCEFDRPDNIPVRRALVWLLEWATQRFAEVELFVCWADDERSEPVRRDWSSPAELLLWRELHEGDLLVIRRESDGE